MTLPMTPPMRPSGISDTDELARSNVEYLRQGRELIERLRDDEYASVEPGSRGGVGAHFRHVLDHYERFARGLESGTIDYDLRERDRELETVRSRALERLDELCAALSRLGKADARRALLVRVDCGGPDDRGGVSSPSSVARELQFLVSHTVHHYAVIALLLRARGVEPGRDFGVAPSTLRYEQGTALCAR
jgi:uncharacterized damage-inducible protein DinB